MLKSAIISLLVLSSLFLMHRLAVLTINENSNTQEWLQNGKSGAGANYYNSYSPTYIASVEQNIQAEAIQLQNIRSTSLFLFVLALTVSVVYIYSKLRGRHDLFKLKQYDGLAVMLFAILTIVTTIALFYYFDSTFHFAPNMKNDIQIIVILAEIYAAPLLFLTAYLINNREMRLSLHGQKWISIISLTLLIVAILVALLNTLAISVSFDMSGF